MTTAKHAPTEIVGLNGADLGDAITAVEALIDRLEKALQGEDVAGFMELFGENPVWVTAHGKRIEGREAIRSFTQGVLPGAMRASTARYEAERIAFLRHDVAVVSVVQRPVTLAGDPMEGVPEGWPTYVLTREHGDWLIAAAQNTQVKNK